MGARPAAYTPSTTAAAPPRVADARAQQPTTGAARASVAAGPATAEFAAAIGLEPERLASAGDRAGISRAELADKATSRHKDERQAVAANPDVPLGVQAMLATDDVHAVRATLARNPVAARSVLESLASDKQREVVMALMENPAVPHDIVERLTADKRDDVRDAAVRRLAQTIHRPPVTQDADAHIPELRERAEVFAHPTPLSPQMQVYAAAAREEMRPAPVEPEPVAPSHASPTPAESAPPEQLAAEGEFLPQEPVESAYAPPEWLYAELPPIQAVPGPYVALAS